MTQRLSATYAERVRRLFDDLVECAPNERAKRLVGIDDTSVKREVAALLAASDRVHTDLRGLDKLHARLAPTRSRGGPRLCAGQCVGPYQITEPLGTGGMGTVYRARDLRLGRPVALKFLHPHLASDPTARQRFLREAKGASALDHPNIGTIYEIRETERGAGIQGGRLFIAMAYYEGDTLKTKIARGPLDVEQAVAYAAQIAKGLHQAHEAGIIHRDVKPANVVVTDRDEVKLVDFGLARMVNQSDLTQTGQTLGTPAYMSPEQARGEAVGPSADLWSLGIVLYEMVTGERPFDGNHPPAFIRSILKDTPPPVHTVRPTVPFALSSLVDELLQKKAADRPPTADDVVTRLVSPTLSLEDPTPVDRTVSYSDVRRHWRTRIVQWVNTTSRVTALHLSVAIVVLALGVAWWLVVTDGMEDASGPPRSAVAGASIAVLPFEVTGAGAEEWGDGMVTTLSTGLDGAAGLRAVADRTIFAAWQQAESPQITAAGNPALDVARQIGSEYAVDGSVVVLGDRLRIIARVYETDSGRTLGRAQVEGPREKLMTLADGLTLHVLEILLGKGKHKIPSIDLASITTESLTAYKAFLRGERHLRAGGGSAFAPAMENFKSAIRADSTFALPYARMALLGLWRHEAQGTFTKKAYELADQLPQRDRRLIRALHLARIEGQTLAAADSFRTLANDYPDDPSVWKSLGEVVHHAFIPNGWPEVDEALQRAAQLDPENVSYYTHNAGYPFWVYQDSTLAARRIAAMPPSPDKTLWQLTIRLVFGSRAERERALDQLDTIRSPFFAPIVEPLVGWQNQPTGNEVLRRVLKHPALYDSTGLHNQHSVRSGIPRNVRHLVSTVLAPHILRNEFAQGHIGDAVADLEKLCVTDAAAAHVLGANMSLGLPIPDSILARYLDPSRIETDAPIGHLKWAAIYLIERGRAKELPSLLHRIRQTGPDQRSPDIQIPNIVAEVEGYRAWRAGNDTEAAQWWSRANESGRAGAIWRGDLYRALGQLDRAKQWYIVGWRHPVAHERLGHLYRQMNRPAKAGAAYQRFVTAWKTADRPLVPRVEKAQAQLAALETRDVRRGITSLLRRPETDRSQPTGS